MNNRLCAIVISLLLLMPTAVSAELYYWIGPDGTKHFSNSPPPPTVEEYGSASEVEYQGSASAGGAAAQNTGNPNETPFRIYKKKILVMVSLSYEGETHSGELVLDTGASATTVFEPAARDFNITEFRPIRVHVAGGQTMMAKGVVVDWFQVGPHRHEKSTIVVLKETGESSGFKGLIGMNFLEKHPYTLDMERKVIVWKSN